MAKLLQQAASDLRVYHAQRHFNRDAIFLTNKIENLEGAKKRSGFLSERDEEVLAFARQRLKALKQERDEIIAQVNAEYAAAAREQAVETARIRRWRHRRKALNARAA